MKGIDRWLQSVQIRSTLYVCNAKMDQIPTSPYKIPRNAYQRELAAIDPAMYLPIPPTLRPLMPILKALLQRTATEPEKTAPAPETKPVPESPYMDFDEACAYLRLTERQLKDLCRDQRITHARIDYRTFRFKRSDLDTWFEAYKLQRKSVYD